MQTQASKFVIHREDLAVDPATVISDGLKIGRLPTCELVLNHPTVSRLHAGINLADRRFYLYNFSNSSGTTLNNNIVPLESAVVLAAGDVVQIGPYFLHMQPSGDTLNIRVVMEVTVNLSDAEARLEAQRAAQAAATAAAAAQAGSAEVSQALSVFWEKRKREAGKMQRLSPLRPQKPARVLGKARFNWTPTRDLVRPWPFSLFVWGAVIIGVLSAAAAVGYTSAYSPAPVSSPHMRPDFTAQPAIAREPNAGSCTTCHTLTASMETQCSSCHTAEAFHSTVTPEHREAGIGCTDCHIEHQGTEYRPSVASIQTCLACHNDTNKKLYNGKAVGTPHGGGAGYPVVAGRWTWEGLSDEAMARKPEEVRLKIERSKVYAPRQQETLGTPDMDAAQLERTAEFHVIHMHRVKVTGGLQGNSQGEVSCSTCHDGLSPIDRETPRQTCGVCHNGDPGGKFQTVLASDAPNCNSCHNQHVEGRRTWGLSLLAGSGGGAPFVRSGDTLAARRDRP